MNWTTGFRDRTKSMTVKNGRTEIIRKPERSFRPVPEASLNKCKSLDLGLDIFDSIRTSSSSKTEPSPTGTTKSTNKVKLVDLEYHEKMRGCKRNRLIEIELPDSPQPPPSKLRLSSLSPVDRKLLTGSTNRHRPAADYKHLIEKPASANVAAEQQLKMTVPKRPLEAPKFIEASVVSNKHNNSRLKSQSTQTSIKLSKDAEAQTDIVLTASNTSFFRATDSD